MASTLAAAEGLRVLPAAVWAEALLAGRYGEGDTLEVRLDPATDTLVFGVGVAADGKIKGALSDAAGDVAGSA